MMKSNLGIALGKRIRNLRLDLNLTQDQLSETAGLSLKHLGELERGRGNPNLSSIGQIADALGVSIGELFDLEHEQMHIDLLRKELVDQIKTVNESSCRSFYRLFRALTK